MYGIVSFFHFYKCMYFHLCGHIDIIFTLRMLLLAHMTQNCGVEVEFDQSSHSSHRDENLIEGKLSYVGKIQEIMQVDFHPFNVLFLFTTNEITSTRVM